MRTVGRAPFATAGFWAAVAAVLAEDGLAAGLLAAGFAASLGLATALGEAGADAGVAAPPQAEVKPRIRRLSRPKRSGCTAPKITRHAGWARGRDHRLVEGSWPAHRPLVRPSRRPHRPVRSR